MGHITQEDPIGFAGGLNLYAYAGNNPATFTDPFGLSPCESSRNRPRGESEEECKARISNGSEIMNDGFRAAEYSLVRNSRCMGSIGSAAATVAGDASFFLGVGAVLRAGVLAFGGGRVAAQLARDEITRDLAPAAIQQSQSWVTAGLSSGGTTLAGQAATSTATNAASAYGGSRISAGSWIPGRASGQAVAQARQQCRR